MMVMLPHLVDLGKLVSPVVGVNGVVQETLRFRADAGQNDDVDVAKPRPWFTRPEVTCRLEKS